MQEAEEDKRLSIFMKLTYAAPTMSTLPVTVLLSIYLNSFYEALGVGLAYISFYIALARSFDVVSDPAMSYITDSTRSSWGRRRPFMLAGCVPYAGLLWGLLHPPVYWLGESLPRWFGIFYILFFISSTVTTIPYDALGPEMTDNYDDRSNLFFVGSIFDAIGSLLAVLLPQFLAYFVVLPRQEWESTADDNCFSPSGEGVACYKEYTTATKLRYNITGGIPDFYSNITFYETQFDPILLECELGKMVQVHHAGSPYRAEGYQEYCDCQDYCKSRAYLTAERFSYSICGFLYGSWFIVTMVNCVYWVRESCQKSTIKLPKAPPLVPMLLNTLKNRAFAGLLPAWVLDALAQAIVASMCVYFVRYVIQPEYAEECMIPENRDNWDCSSLKVLGAGVTLLLMAALVSCPMWLLLLKRLGKVRAWLLWSLTMAVTNTLLLAPQKGQVALFLAVCFLNGLPFSAKFLSDSILADVIDYDEFLSGQRSEATYTMFKGFLPKICAIPALAIPIAVLNAIGHVPPDGSRPEKQPPQIRIYCIIVSVLLPTILSLCAWYIKTQFPLKTKRHVQMVSEGVAEHRQGLPAVEPITGVEYIPLETDDEEESEVAVLLDAFPGQKTVVTLLENQSGSAAEDLVTYTVWQFRKSLVLAACLMVLSYWCYNWFIESTVLSVLPVITIILFGVSVTYMCFCFLRCGYAKQLCDLGVCDFDDLLQRICEHRKLIHQVFHDPAVDLEEEHSLGDGEKDDEEGGGSGGNELELTIISPDGLADKSRSTSEEKVAAGAIVSYRGEQAGAEEGRERSKPNVLAEATESPSAESRRPPKSSQPAPPSGQRGESESGFDAGHPVANMQEVNQRKTSNRPGVTSRESKVVAGLPKAKLDLEAAASSSTGKGAAEADLGGARAAGPESRRGPPSQDGGDRASDGTPSDPTSGGAGSGGNQRNPRPQEEAGETRNPSFASRGGSSPSKKGRSSKTDVL